MRNKIFIIIYIIFVFLVTVLLFSFNRFSNSELGDKVIACAKVNFSTFKKGDLLIIRKNDRIKIGDEVVFYDTNEVKNYLNSETVKRVIKTNEKETTYEIRDNEYLSSEYVLATTKNVKSYPLLGYIYLITTSYLGYPLFVIIPIVGYFIYLLKKYGYVKKKKKKKNKSK